MTKPFKTVTTEYYRQSDDPSSKLNFDDSLKPLTEQDSRIRVVTTSKQWVGSNKDPVTSTSFEYL
jgi:hypothetical protein